MAKILSIKAREILDSRGIPTIETQIKTNKGTSTASVPAGRSKGIHEAFELRDGGKRYQGKGVSKAVKIINTKIARKLKGKKPEQADEKLLEMDNTSKKTKFGANTVLSVSMASTRAAAQAKAMPLYQHISAIFNTKKNSLPIPSFNIINGGRHAGNRLDIQEYMISPIKAKTFSEAMQIGSEIYHELKEILHAEYGKRATNIGDEGGFSPQLECYQAPLDLIMDAVRNTGYYKKIKLGIDAAATNFYRNGKYYLEGTELTPDELTDKYKEITQAYPLTSIEDPFQENDFKNFAKLNKKLKKIQIIGDDLLCTNPLQIQKAIITEACDTLLLKMNQIGTVTEALDAAKIAIKQGWKVKVSHRSGETNDSFIADLAAGIGCGQIKAGAPCRGERLAKYNRLLEIEEQSKIRYGEKK